MPPNPEIPTRTSSTKRRASTSIEEEQAAKIKKLGMRIKIKKLDLKPHESLDSSYWRARASVSQLLQEKDVLKKKQSIQNFKFQACRPRGEMSQAWLETAEGKEIVEIMRAHELDYKMCERRLGGSTTIGSITTTTPRKSMRISLRRTDDETL
ncbi:hypothetical protein XPA_005613 [Xanthoria parietina]